MILSLVVAVIGIALFVVLKQVAKLDRFEEQSKQLKLGAALALVVGILPPVLVGVTSTFRTVPTGNVGVTSLGGQVREAPLSEGFNITLPIYDVTNMSVQLQKHVSTYTASTKDMQQVHVDMVLNFRLDASKAPLVLRDTGIDYLDKVIDPAAQEVLKAETANHDAADLLKNRPTVKDVVQGKLKLWLAKYHIVLEEVALADIKFEQAYTHAIEQKQVQQQVAAQREYELQQATKEAEIAEAKAHGLAESRKIAADGEAEYNKKVAASITPEIIKMEYLKRWNGVLPHVLADGKGGLLFSVDTSESEKK